MPSSEPWILGLSSAFHNGAACLLHGDRVVVAIQEERLSRIKRAHLPHDRPSLAVEYCLAAAGLSATDLDAIVDCTIAPAGVDALERLRAMPVAEAAGPGVPLYTMSHHLGHAYSAFCTSGFSESLVLVIDGGGSFASQLSEDEKSAARESGPDWCEHVSIYHASEEGVVALEKHLSPMPYLDDLLRVPGMPRFASLGHMYASASHQIFGQYLEAGKVMALASYAAPGIPVEDFLSWKKGRFEFSDEVPARFRHDDRWPARAEEYYDLAASTQRALEYALNQIIVRLHELQPRANLCYAGGVALNGVANHAAFQRSNFADLYLIPAAEDSGPALGAAYWGLRHLTGKCVSPDLGTDFLGRSYTTEEIQKAIANQTAITLVQRNDVLDAAVDLLCEGKVVGWFAGGCEFGPRALGHRSLLFDPRRGDAREILNRRVKFREPFRPFAPAVLGEHVEEWFVTGGYARLTDYMLDICPFREVQHGPAVPGVLHIDGTGRVQAVWRESNPRFHELISRFHLRTGVPMVINTSFNVAGEAIVETPAEALRCLQMTGIDACVLENFLVLKDHPSAAVSST